MKNDKHFIKLFQRRKRVEFKYFLEEKEFVREKLLVKKLEKRFL